MKKVHIYSHTHWDYEWYFTANESNIQLVYHMDEVIQALQNHDIETYLLDSQISILEEYLSLMPSKKEIIKHLIREKRLLVGPWYTQSDELIISGESIVRNLWYGIQGAKALGNCMPVGYLPDSFGQSKDMPKIYHGFAIPYCVFWRGVSKEACNQREFIWKGKDGSQVLTYNIKDGYFYGGNLIYTDDIDMVEKRILDGATTVVQLLPVGGDQRYVDFNLKERIEYYNRGSTHLLQYQESDLLTFFKELEKEEDLPVVEGEFIDGSVSKIHHSIYSSRYDHKVLNDTIERRIIYQLEPFMVMQQSIGISPKTSVLDALWKKVLLNHAHDSACGCNSDPTNQSILQRLQDCDQMSSMLLDYQVRKCSESFNDVQDNDILVYNTLPYYRKSIQVFTIHTKTKNFRIVDEQNKNIAFESIKQIKEYSGSIRKNTRSYDDEKYYYQTTISLVIEIQAMARQKLHVIEMQEGVLLSPISLNPVIENQRFKIMIKDGKCNIFDKLTGYSDDNAIYIEDSGDEGDTYDYSNPIDDVCYPLHFDNSKIKILDGAIEKQIEIKGTWNLPYNLQKRRLQILDSTIPYTLLIRLYSDYISFDMTIENKAIDHRMRVIFNSHIISQHSYSDSQYGVVVRENTPTHLKDWKEQGYKEEPTPIYPMLHHVSIQDEMLTCSLFSKGIKEYEILEDGKIALTLFRSVSYLGKPDLQRRPGIASGNEFKYVKTPKSRLLQPLSFAFACTFYQQYQEATISKDWLMYATDMLYYQMQEYNRFINTQKYFVTHPYMPAITPMIRGISMDLCTKIALAAILPLDDNSYLLRVYNPSSQIVKNEKIKVGNVKKVCEVNFLCDIIKEHEMQEEILEIDLFAPEEIKCFKIICK